MSAPSGPSVPKLKAERKRFDQLARFFMQRLEDYQRFADAQFEDIAARSAEMVARLDPTIEPIIRTSRRFVRQGGALASTALDRLQNEDLIRQRQQEAAARAAAEAMSAAERQRQAALDRLSRFGVDPTQVAATALDRAARTQAALAAAQAGTLEAANERQRFLQEQSALAQLGGQFAEGGARLARSGADLGTGVLGFSTLPIDARNVIEGGLGAIGGLAGEFTQNKVATELGRFDRKAQQAQAKAGFVGGLLGSAGQLAGTLIGAKLYSDALSGAGAGAGAGLFGGGPRPLYR